jgi:hypothetical protein
METKKTLVISTEKAKELYKSGSEDMKSLLLKSFSKEELAQEFLKNFRPLLDKFYKIMY